METDELSEDEVKGQKATCQRNTKKKVYLSCWCVDDEDEYRVSKSIELRHF